MTRGDRDQPYFAEIWSRIVNYHLFKARHNNRELQTSIFQMEVPKEKGKKTKRRGTTFIIQLTTFSLWRDEISACAELLQKPLPGNLIMYKWKRPLELTERIEYTFAGLWGVVCEQNASLLPFVTNNVNQGIYRNLSSVLFSRSYGNQSMSGNGILQ